MMPRPGSTYSRRYLHFRSDMDHNLLWTTNLSFYGDMNTGGSGKNIFLIRHVCGSGHGMGNICKYLFLFRGGSSHGHFFLSKNLGVVAMAALRRNLDTDPALCVSGGTDLGLLTLILSEGVTHTDPVKCFSGGIFVFPTDILF